MAEFDVVFEPEPEVGDEVFTDLNLSRPVSTEYAEQKAEKTDLGVGPEVSPGKSELVRSTVNGEDKFTRDELVNLTALNQRAKATQLVDQYLELRKTKLKGAPATEKELDYLINLTSKEQQELIKDPSTFFEKAYAKYAVQKTLVDTEVFRGTLVDNPTLAQNIKTVTENSLAKREIFEGLQEEYRQIWQDAGAVSTTLNVVGLLAPYVSWWNTQSRTDGPISSFLQGSNIKEQVQNLWLLPPDEAKEAARKALEEISENSKIDALQFAMALTTYSTTEENIDNTFSALDVATGILGKAAVGAAKTSLRSASATKAISPSVAAKATGNAPGAAKIDIKAEITGQAERIRGRVGSLEELKDEVPTLFDVNRVIEGASNVTSTYANRLRETLESSSNALLKAALSDPINIKNLEGAALNTALAEAEREVRRTHPHLPNTIVSIEPRSNADSVIGLQQIAVQFGKHDGSLFKTEGDARFIAEHVFQLPDGGWNVGQRGDHFFVEVVQNVDESLPSIREALRVQTQGERSMSSINLVMGALRGNDYVLPKNIVDAFKTATYGGNAILEAVQSVGKVFSQLGKGREDFVRFLTSHQQYVDPSAPDRIGKFSQNLGEFSKDWQDMFGRAPTELEATAYFQYKQINDLDYAVNNLGIYRDKSRVGIQNARITVSGKVSGKVEGKPLREMPWHMEENTGILIVEEGADAVVRMKDFLFTNQRADIDEMLRSGGYRLTQITQNGEEVLREMPELTNALSNAGEVSFVISRKTDYSPLDYKQLPYREGGHILYPEGFFVKQPKVRRRTNAGGAVENIYNGDTSIFNFQNRAQANRFAEAMETARSMLRTNGSTPELRQFVTDNLPMDFADFTRLFSENGPLSIDQRIVATGSNQSVDDVVNLGRTLPGFRKRSDSVYNLYNQVGLKFAQERGLLLNTIVEGTVSNPLIHTRQAEVIDPITALDRSATNLLRGRYMEPAKQKAAQQFVSQFADVLDLSDPLHSENYMRALLEAPIKTDTPNKAMAAAAKNYRRRTLEFLGQKTNEHKIWDQMRWSVADTLYERLGQRGIDRTPDFLLASEKDPIKFFRTVAFHAKLGLFNPVQLIQQAQTMANVIAIAGPLRGASSAMATSIMRTLSMNPSMVDGASKFAKSFGWKPEDFKESYEWMRRSGFDRIGKEVVQLDDYFDTSVVKSRTGNVLDAGLFFFQEGERFVRMSAWNAAYSEWKVANPTLKVTNDVAQELLARADLLTVNMSRASQASWQQGILSIPTQFMSYQVRLMEQFIGGQLTAAEKARLFTTFSLMYGAPVAASGVVGGVWPIHENIKGALQSNGIDVEENALYKTLNDGLTSMFLEATTGERKNFGERMGPSGIPLFRDLLRGDKKVHEMVAGVSGSTTLEFASTALPVVSSIYGAFSGDDAWYPLLESDVLQFMSTISSVNQGRQAYNALFLGKYITRSGIQVTDQDKFNGVLNSLIGTSPQAVSDMFRGMDLDKDLQAHQREVGKEIKKLFKLAMNAEDDDEQISLFKKIKLNVIRGGFQPYQIPRLLRDITQGEENLLDKYERRKLTKSPKEVQLYMNKIIRRNAQREQQ